MVDTVASRAGWWGGWWSRRQPFDCEVGLWRLFCVCINRLWWFSRKSTFTFTRLILTQFIVKKWNFYKTESKRKQSCVLNFGNWYQSMTTVHGANNFKQTPQSRLGVFPETPNWISISSRSTRPKDRNSRSRLEAWDWREEILDLVSKHETDRQKFSISSRSMRLKGRNSRSRLESWKMDLAMLCRGAINAVAYWHSHNFLFACFPAEFLCYVLN